MITRIVISVGVLITYWDFVKDSFPFDGAGCDSSDRACQARGIAHDSGPVIWMIILTMREISNLALMVYLHYQLQEKVEDNEDAKGLVFFFQRAAFLLLRWIVHAFVGAVAILIAGVFFTFIGCALIAILAVLFVAWFWIYDCCCCCNHANSCKCSNDCKTCTCGCCVCVNGHSTQCCTCCGVYSVPALMSCICPLYGVFIYFWVWIGNYYIVLGSEYDQPWIGVPHVWFLLDVLVPFIEEVPEIVIRSVVVFLNQFFHCVDLHPPKKPQKELAKREQGVVMAEKVQPAQPPPQAAVNVTVVNQQQPAPVSPMVAQAQPVQPMMFPQQPYMIQPQMVGGQPFIMQPTMMSPMQPGQFVMAQPGQMMMMGPGGQPMYYQPQMSPQYVQPQMSPHQPQQQHQPMASPPAYNPNLAG